MQNLTHFALSENLR